MTPVDGAAVVGVADVGVADGAAAGVPEGGGLAFAGVADGGGLDIFYTGNRMKAYHLYFLFLKGILVIQTMLIIFQKNNPNTISYIAGNILFKTSLGLFLMIFFTFSKIPDMDFYDQLIAYFAGVFLAFEGLYIGVPLLLVKLGFTLPSWIVVQKA